MALRRHLGIETKEEGRYMNLGPQEPSLCHLLPSMPLAAVGYLDGTLAIYDLSTQTLRHQCQHQV